MFSAVTPILTLLAATAIYVRADPNPSSPGPGDVFIEGKPCTISWDVDLTGVWKNMNIDLMTGDNFNMVFLTSVATSIDGTNPSKNTFSYPCPQVTPHSAIYFYQFTSPSSSNKAWTGRFTITDSASNIVPPSESTQPDGTNIPWGTGSLVNASSSATPSASGASANSSTLTSSAPAVTSGLFTPSPDTPSLGVVDITTDFYTPVTTSTVSTTGATTGANGAVTTLSVSNILQTGLALGIAAFGFTAMF